MSNDIIELSGKVPAHLAVLGDMDEDWSSGLTAGFPIISTKGKVFHIKRGDDTELVTDPNDPEEAARSLQVVIIKTGKGITKTFYASTYEEGSQDKPDCYSLDGVRPAADAEDRQCKTCAACPQNQWGSRKTESGKDAKRCSDVKRVAVAPVGLLNDPMLLRIPPTSIRTWDLYVDLLRKRGVTPNQVITKISFDPSVAHQALVFKAVGFTTDEMVPSIVEARNSTTVEQMLGTVTEGVDTTPVKEEAPPAKKPPAKRKPPAKKKPAPKEEEQIDIEDVVDDADDAEASDDVDLGDDFDFSDDDFDFDD